MLHIVAHLLQVVVETGLLLRVEGHQADHPDAVLLHHDGHPEKGPLPAALLATAPLADRILAGVGDDLLALMLDDVAQQAGVPLQLATEELAVRAGSRHPHHVGVHDFHFQLQHAGQHLGKAQNGGLDLHQQTLVTDGHHVVNPLAPTPGGIHAGQILCQFDGSDFAEDHEKGTCTHPASRSESWRRLAILVSLEGLVVVIDQDVLPKGFATGNQGCSDLPVQLPMATRHIDRTAIMSLERADRQQLVPAIAFGGELRIEHRQPLPADGVGMEDGHEGR